MTRNLTVGAAQLGPIAKGEPRDAVVERLLTLLDEAASAGVELVVYPELALTTFFPRWYLDDPDEIDSYYETEMPSPVTQPLFDAAKRAGIGFCLGFAELATDPDGTVHRYNSQVLVERDGSTVATFRKIHIPGHEHNEDWREFQHLERRYFEPGPDGFGVWPAFGGLVGMMICNDRRWPETYRVMGLQGVELILCGYNTPIHYAPDPGQDRLQGFPQPPRHAVGGLPERHVGGSASPRAAWRRASTRSPSRRSSPRRVRSWPRPPPTVTSSWWPPAISITATTTRERCSTSGTTGCPSTTIGSRRSEASSCPRESSGPRRPTQSDEGQRRPAAGAR